MPIFQLLLFALLPLCNYDDANKRDKYNYESEVRKMTMEEIKEKLLKKIDDLLANADAEDVRRLTDAYTNLNREMLLEKMAKNNNSMFNGCANMASISLENKQEGNEKG